MSKLAIRGHKERGEEVIKILEMLGGENGYKLSGTNEKCAYYEKNGRIHNTAPVGFNNFKLFTLEEFIDKFPYKVGDNVSYIGGDGVITSMTWSLNENEILYGVQYGKELKQTTTTYLRPYEKETIETITIEDFHSNTKEWLIDKLESMSKDDALQTICDLHDELHKPQFPTTYVDCCEVLNIIPTNNLVFSNPNEESEYAYRNLALYNDLDKLKVCRDAYWKIAGELVGLGKPWEPDWLNTEQDKFVLYTYNNVICSNRYVLGHNVLAFPTKEMRDAFYENFKDLIEECKELL